MSTPRRRKSPARQPARQQTRHTNRHRQPATGNNFWGTEDTGDDLPNAITPSDDPAAMITSLGPPPIPGHETGAQHYFDAVYAKAAGLAIALAAASGLLSMGDDVDDPE